MLFRTSAKALFVPAANHPGGKQRRFDEERVNGIRDVRGIIDFDVNGSVGGRDEVVVISTVAGDAEQERLEISGVGAAGGSRACRVAEEIDAERDAALADVLEWAPGHHRIGSTGRDS